MTAIDLDRIRELMQPQRATLRALTRQYTTWAKWLATYQAPAYSNPEDPAVAEADPNAVDAIGDEAGQRFRVLLDVLAHASDCLSQTGPRGDLSRALLAFLGSVTLRTPLQLWEHAHEVRTVHDRVIRVAGKLARFDDHPEAAAIMAGWLRLQLAWRSGLVTADQPDTATGIMNAILMSNGLEW